MNSTLGLLRSLLVTVTALVLASCGCTCLPREKGHVPTLTGLRLTPAEQNGSGCDIFTLGHGRQHVLFLHEITGLSPACLQAAKTLSDAGFTVHLPRFFGTVPERGKYGLSLMRHGFSLFSAHETGREAREKARRAADWCTAQARRQDASARLIVIGNCLTGTIPVELLARPDVKAAVVCQPALPFLPILGRSKALALPEPVIRATLKSMQADRSKHLISVNYERDCVGTIARQKELARRLGAAGLADRHTVILGTEDPGSASGFHGSRVIPLRTHSSAQHSTLTGTSPPDPQVFLRLLIDLIR